MIHVDVIVVAYMTMRRNVHFTRRKFQYGVSLTKQIKVCDLRRRTIETLDLSLAFVTPNAAEHST